MSKLLDYSGKFDPKFSHGKFTRDTLLKLLKLYSQYAHRMDGFWYLTVMDRWGNDEAFDCDVKVWRKYQLYETKVISDLLNIHGEDVVSVMKLIQVTRPAMWTYDYEIDIKNSDHAIFTVSICPTLFAIEKEGTGRERRICQGNCYQAHVIMAHYFNPDIMVTQLKLPPRASDSDVCCQWEFKLERSRPSTPSRCKT
jgi:hypothetical protein